MDKQEIYEFITLSMSDDTLFYRELSTLRRRAAVRPAEAQKRIRRLCPLFPQNCLSYCPTRVFLTRISRPRTCMCTTVLRKNYAGHKVCRPTARQSNFYQSKVTYHGELGLCRTHATMHTSLHSFSLCPHRFLRPPTFSLFMTQSSRSWVIVARKSQNWMTGDEIA